MRWLASNVYRNALYTIVLSFPPTSMIPLGEKTDSQASRVVLSANA